MTRVWTVHAPPPGAGAAAEGPALVPEGFSLAAALLPPLWLLWHRQWLALLGWLVLAIGIGALLPPGLAGLAGLGLALLVGLQAQDIRRWTMARRGRPVRAIVTGRDAEAALLRLFEARPDLGGERLA